MNVESLHRRSFFGAMVALFSTALPGSGRWFAPAGAAQTTGRESDSWLALRLIDLLRARSKVVLIGQIHLWGRKPLPTLTELVDGVLPGELRSQHLRSEKWRLRRAVKTRIATDYGQVRLVNVQGWLVSQTEARIAAITALVTESPHSSISVTGTGTRDSAT